MRLKAPIVSSSPTSPRLVLHQPDEADLFRITGFEGTERLSEPFTFQVNLLADKSTAESYPPENLVGNPLSVGVLVGTSESGERRYFHGVVSRCALVGTHGQNYAYEAEMVPWTWLLSQTADCRIFQNLSVVEIVEKVFVEARSAFPQLVHFRFDLQRDKKKYYPPLDYCVQYRETDYSFVSRLLEQEGIYYYFEQEQNRHTLVLADSPDHDDVAFSSEAQFRAGTGNNAIGPTITHWKSEKRFIPGKYSLGDFHFQMPEAWLATSQSSLVDLPADTPSPRNAELEVFDFPAETAQRFNQSYQRLDKVKEVTEIQNRTRMEELESRHAIAGGKSNCSDFGCGLAFHLKGHADELQNRRYLLTCVSHWARQSCPGGSHESEGLDYINDFRCVPHDINFRPSRRTPKPVIQGVQSALVESPAGREIEIDEFGRVLVRFPWDRQARPNKQNSCWLRVAQPSAGQGWGTSFWPRAGTEVLVSFMEGDPDQPIIVGSVYNAQNLPRGDVRSSQTKSGMSSRSLPDGGSENYSAIVFENQSGQEELFVQAERDLNFLVKNDEGRYVGGLRETTIEDYDLLTVINGAHEVQSKSIILEATDKLTLKVGRSLIELGPDSIKIDSPIVLINS